MQSTLRRTTTRLAAAAVTASLAWLFLKERISPRRLLGVLCTVAGVLLIQGLTTGRLTPEHLWGNLLVLGAAVSESVFNIISRVNTVKAPQASPINPIVQTTLVSALALIFCVIPMLFEQPLAALGAIGLTQWLALGWYGVFVTALAFICWYAGIRRCPARVLPQRLE